MGRGTGGAFELGQPEQAPLWYSAIERAVQQSGQTRATGAQWLATLSKIPGVKKEELDWIGLPDWLKANDEVAQVDWLTHLRALGYNTERMWFHGTTHDFEQFDPSITRPHSFGGGISASSDPTFASGFPRGEGANVRPIYVRGRILAPEEWGPRSDLDAPGIGGGMVNEHEIFIRDPANIAPAYGPTTSAKPSPVTREEVLAFVRANGVVVKEVVLGGDGTSPAIQRELLPLVDERTRLWNERVMNTATEQLTPEQQETVALINERLDVLDSEIERLREQVPASPQATRWTQYMQPGGTNPREFVLYVEGIEPYAASDTSHYGDIGGGRAVVWFRADERVDANGLRTFHVAEIQSKRHQDGREKGYGRPDISGWTARNEAGHWIVRNADGEIEGSTSTSIDGSASEAIDAVALRQQLASVPDAPFKNNAWAALAFKRIIRYASDNGFDQIAWTRGQHQNDRYNLSRYGDELRLIAGRELELRRQGQTVMAYDTTREGESLEDLVGKEVAAKLLAAPQVRSADGPARVLGNLERMEIGGEGMRAFYDRILPNIANDLGKKYGARVGETTIPVPPSRAQVSAYRPDDFAVEQRGDQWAVTMDRSRVPGQPLFATRTEAEATLRSILDGYANVQETVHALPLTPEMRAAAQEGMALFQPNWRGSIRYKNFDAGRMGTALIRLRQSANLSTFLHEFGHFGHLVLEAVATDPAAPDEFKRMWESTLSWWGVDQAHWDGLSDKQRKPYFERWAESFETYLMEGKAPSPSLRESFRAFGSWLVALYKSVLNREPLTPQIRDVFARLLATEEEIAEARAASGADFAVPRLAGETEEAYAVRLKATGDAHEAMESELRARFMDKHTRGNKRWWRGERARLRPAAERAVDSDPARRALEWLGFQEFRALPDTELSEEGETAYVAAANAMETMPEGLPAMRLDLAATSSLYGPEAVAALPEALRPLASEADLDAALENAMAMKKAGKTKQPTRLWAAVKQYVGPDGRRGIMSQEVLDALGSGRIRPGVVNMKDGNDPDVVAMAMWEAGYFGAVPRKGELGQFGGPKAASPTELGQPGDGLPMDEVSRAETKGYAGADTGEASEWLRAVAKGLPMDEASRMARAKAMGYTTPLVHTVRPQRYAGEAPVFEEFDSNITHSPGDPGYWGVGTYFLPLSEKSLFTEGGKMSWRGAGYDDTTQGAYTMPVLARIEKPFISREAGDIMAQMDFSSAAPWDTLDKSIYPYDQPPFIVRQELRLDAKGFRRVSGLFSQALKKAGYDAVINARADQVPATWAPGEPLDYRAEVVILHPKGIRSVHAAFDPDLTEIANLLAQPDDDDADVTADRRPTPRELIDALIDDIKNVRQIFSSRDGDALAAYQNRADALKWFEGNGVDLDGTKEEIRAQLRAVLAREQSGEGAPLADPDTAASWFGFSSGDELLKALAALAPRATAIEQKIDDLAEAEHGDPLARAGAAAEAARLAAHIETQARKIELELAAIERAGGGRKTPTARAARAMAERHIAAMTVRQVRKYDAFLAGERRAAKAALAATQKGDMLEAGLWKQRQLVSFHLYKLARKAADQLDRDQAYFRKFERGSVRAGIHTPLLDQIDETLESIDLRKRSPGYEKNRQSFLAWYAEMQEEGLADQIMVEPEFLAKIARRPFNTLTLEEARGLKDAVRNFEHIGRRWNKVLAARDARLLGELVDGLAANMAAVKPFEAVNPDDHSPGAVEQLDSWRQNAHAFLTRPEFVFHAMDGHKALGPLQRALIQPLRDARGREENRQEAAQKKVGELFALYSDKERADMWTLKRYYSMVPSTSPAAIGSGRMGASFTKQEILSIALNVGNEYNENALLAGFKWTPQQLFALLDQAMDGRDWAFVQSVWDYVDSFWPEIAKLYEDMAGVAPPKVEARPFQNRYGQFAGGYYHLQYDFGRDQRARDEYEFGKVQEAFGSSPRLRAQTPNGFAKARQGSGGRPVRLDLSVLTEHINGVIHDLEFRLPVLDAWRVIKHAEFRAAFVRAAGQAQYDQLKPWLIYIASERMPPENIVSGVFKHFRKNTPIALMGYSLSTVAQQPAGVLGAAHKLGAARLAGAIADFMAKPWTWLDRARFINARSQFMAHRTRVSQREIREMAASVNNRAHVDAVNLLLTGTLRQKSVALGQIRDVIGKHALYPLAAVDKFVSSIPWMLAYQDAMAGRVKNVDAQNEKDAVAYADHLIATTFGSGRPEDLPPVMRANEFSKMITPAFSYFSTQYNQIYNDQIPGMMRGRISPIEFVTFITLAVFMQTLLSEWAAGRWEPDDDEDEETRNKRLMAATATAPVAGVPLIRDMARGFAQHAATGQQPRVNPIPGYGALQDTGTAVAGITDYVGGTLAGDEPEFDRATARAATMASGYWFGVPSNAVWKFSEGVSDIATGEDDLSDPAATGRELFLRDTR